MAELQFAIVFIDSEDHHVDVLTNFSVLRRMVEALQPAQVADVDHTTDTRSQFYEHTIRSDVFHQTCMTAAFWEFGFDSAPWIFAHLLDRQAHFAIVLIERNDLRFVLITQFEEFFRIDRCVSPGNFTYVNQTFNTWHDFQECAVIFDIHHFTFHYRTFVNVFWQNIPRMWS